MGEVIYERINTHNSESLNINTSSCSPDSNSIPYHLSRILALDQLHRPSVHPLPPGLRGSLKPQPIAGHNISFDRSQT